MGECFMRTICLTLFHSRSLMTGVSLGDTSNFHSQERKETPNVRHKFHRDEERFGKSSLTGLQYVNAYTLTKWDFARARPKYEESWLQLSKCH